MSVFQSLAWIPGNPEDPRPEGVDQSAQTHHPDGGGVGRPVRAVENTQRDRRRELRTAVFIREAALPVFI